MYFHFASFKKMFLLKVATGFVNKRLLNLEKPFIYNYSVF